MGKVYPVEQKLNSLPRPGSVLDIQARLLLWCRRSDSGLARVEFTSEPARQRVLQGMRSALVEAGIPFREIRLSHDQQPTPLVRDLITELKRLPRGVVSLDGFPAALPADSTQLNSALYVFNFNRENLAQPHQRQIWWMPPYFADVFLRCVPDLNSWFLLRLQLTEEVQSSAVIQRDGGFREEDVDFGSGSVTARQQAMDFGRRLEHGLRQGVPATELREHLLYPALAGLERAGLQKESIDFRDNYMHRLFDGGIYDNLPVGPIDSLNLQRPSG